MYACTAPSHFTLRSPSHPTSHIPAGGLAPTLPRQCAATPPHSCQAGTNHHRKSQPSCSPRSRTALAAHHNTISENLCIVFDARAFIQLRAQASGVMQGSGVKSACAEFSDS